VNSGLQRSLAGFLEPALGERGTQLLVGKCSLRKSLVQSQMMTKHNKSVLNVNMSNHYETEDDDRSTSAGGSDSEADASTCESDSALATRDGEKEFELLSKNIVVQKAGKMAEKGQSCIKLFAQYLADKCRCSRRSPKAPVKYDRNLLLQIRLPVEQQTRTVAPLPKAMMWKLPESGVAKTCGMPEPTCGEKKLERPPPCTKLPRAQKDSSCGIAPPPGLDLPAGCLPQSLAVPKVFDSVAFRKELVNIFRELSFNKNVGLAVQRVRDQSVPMPNQAEQFADIVTRSADEKVCATRRLRFAFAAGLAKAEHSAFEKSECIEGLRIFFQEVYDELRTEVPRLRSIVMHELLPPLRTAIPAKELNKLLPAEFKTN